MLLIEIALIHSVMNLNLSNARNVTIDGDRLREQQKCASNFLSNAKRLSRFILWCVGMQNRISSCYFQLFDEIQTELRFQSNHQRNFK